MELLGLFVFFLVFSWFMAYVVKAPAWLTLILGVAISFALYPPTKAEAAGRAYTPSRSYAPRPAPRIVPKPTVTRNVTVNKTTVNRTTVIQQRGSRGSSGPSAAGSFMSGAAGAFGGSLLGSWLMAPKEQEQPQQVPQEDPMVPVVPQCDATLYDCTPKVAK